MPGWSLTYRSTAPSMTADPCRLYLDGTYVSPAAGKSLARDLNMPPGARPWGAPGRPARPHQFAAGTGSGLAQDGAHRYE